MQIPTPSVAASSLTCRTLSRAPYRPRPCAENPRPSFAFSARDSLAVSTFLFGVCAQGLRCRPGLGESPESSHCVVQPCKANLSFATMQYNTTKPLYQVSAEWRHYFIQPDCSEQATMIGHVFTGTRACLGNPKSTDQIAHNLSNKPMKKTVAIITGGWRPKVSHNCLYLVSSFNLYSSCLFLYELVLQTPDRRNQQVLPSGRKPEPGVFPSPSHRILQKTTITLNPGPS